MSEISAKSKSGFSAKSRKILYILAAIIVISRLALAFRPEIELASRPYLEDSYYAFSTAYHIAEGRGITADGVQLTNGIQPLIVFLYVPFFAVADGDKWLALRLLFILLAEIEVCSMIAIAKLLKGLHKVDDAYSPDWQLPWIIGALLWTFLYPLMWHNLNGLETGLYALLILVAMSRYLTLHRTDEPTTLSWIGFGVILGLTVLARIDAVFLIAGFAASEILHRKKEGIRSSVIFGLVALVTSLPWWIYNYVEFGSFMPISGQSQSLSSTLGENILRAAVVLADIVSTFFYLPFYDVQVLLLPIWIVIVFTTAFRLFQRINLFKLLRERSRIELLLPLAVSGGACLIYYVFFFGAEHFLPRYLHPIRLLWIIVFALSFPMLLISFKASYAENKWLVRFIIAPVVLAAVFFSVNRYAANYSPKTSDLYKAGKWAAMVSPAKVGMLQSGTAGFVAANVVNLDGKVNPEAIAARKSGKLGEYIKAQDFEYLADTDEMIGELMGPAQQAGLDYRLIDSIGSVRIYQRQ